MDPRLTLALIAALAMCSGCVSQDDAEAPAKAFPHATARAAPTVNLATGTIDAKQVGVWKNATDTYTFRADGTYQLFWDRMLTVRPGQQQEKTGGSKGRWSVAGDNIMMVSDDGVKFRLVRVLSNGGKTLEMHALYVSHGTVYQKASSNPTASEAPKKPGS